MNTADERGLADVRKIEDLWDQSCFVDGSRTRVFLLDESHQLTNHAQEFLLKPSESIPEDIYLVFSSTEPDKFKKTLQNRCMRIEFKPIPENEMNKLLTDVAKWERIRFTEEALDSIVHESEGMARNALTLLQMYAELSKVERMGIGKVETWVE